jgi:hypothetical protein
MDGDWLNQDEITEQIRTRQAMTIKDNKIKDLETSNLFLQKTNDNLLKEIHDLRRGLIGPDEKAKVAPGQIGGQLQVHLTEDMVLNNPEILIKLQELRNAGEQLQQDLAKLRETFKSDS